MKFSITIQMIHHTTDANGVSIQSSKGLPAFTVEAMNVEHAKMIAADIVLPFELQYEHLEAHISAVAV